MKRYLLFICILFLNIDVVYTQSYSLQKALQTAKNNNLFLKVEKINIDIANTEIINARLRPNPTLNMQFLQLLDNRYLAENSRFFGKQNQQIWWQLTKVFQTPAQRKYKINFASQNTITTQKNYIEIERNLYLEVANKWIEAWYLKKQLEIISEGKSNIDTLLRINLRRLKNQVITQTELLRTELLANQYQLKQKTSEQLFLNKLKELKLVTGIKDSINIEINDDFAIKTEFFLDSLLKNYTDKRADIIALKSSLQATEINIKLQKAKVYPQPELGLIWNPQNNIPYFGFFGTIELPFFNRNQGEISKAKIQKMQIEQAILANQVKINTEINIAFYAFKLQKENLEKFNAMLSISQTILNNVKYAYLRGGTTIIDFLEAQRSWLETQQQYYEVLQQLKQTYIQVLWASGQISQLAE